MTNTRDRPRSKTGPVFQVKKKNIEFFMIDNCIIDDYAARLGPYALAVYCYLVREAYRKTGEAKWKSFQDIADTLGMSRRMVIYSISVLTGEDAKGDQPATLDHPLIGKEHTSTARSKVANKENIYSILQVVGSASYAPPPVQDMHPPVQVMHSTMQDMHPSVQDMHPPVQQMHPYKEQEGSRGYKTMDQEGASPPFPENGNSKNGDVPTPPHSPPSSITPGHVRGCMCALCMPQLASRGRRSTR